MDEVLTARGFPTPSCHKAASWSASQPELPEVPPARAVLKRAPLYALLLGVGSGECEWSSLEGIPHPSEGHMRCLPVLTAVSQVYMNIYAEVLASLGSCGSLTPEPRPPPGTVTEAG